MSVDVWPKYKDFAIGDFPLVLRFAANPGRFRAPLMVVLLLGLYVAGMFVPIPGSFRAGADNNGWWFLTLLDSLLTGGALGRGCIFGMGLLAPLLLGAGSRVKRGVPEVFFRYTIGLGLGAAILVLTLRVRGLVGPGVRQFGVAVLWIALGGVAVTVLNTRLLRYRGPAPFYVNLFVTIVVSLRGSAGHLLAARQYAPLYLLAGSVGFIAISSAFLLKSRIRIEVESLEPAGERRTAQLEIAPVDELLLDSVSMMCLVLFLCLGGCVSLAFGWRALAPNNYPVLLGISALSFFLVWWSFATLNRYQSILRLVDVTGILKLPDPHAYALRMLNNFWIISGVSAGPDTEHYIGQRLAGSVRKSFLLLASWVAIAIALQYVVTRSDPGAMLLPYGPLVFVLTVLMLVGNFSMVLSHVSGSLSQFRQLLRGQSRVLAETLPLGFAGTGHRVALDAELRAYWEEDKISEQFDEVVDWMKLVRDMRLLEPKATRPRFGFVIHLQKWIANIVIGAVVTFVAGALCLFIWPDISRRDLGVVVLPMLVSSVFAPDVILRLVKAIRPR
jgi:hypothetical protein